MPARTPLSFSAGKQQTQEESHRSRDHVVMIASCVLASIFGLVTTGFALYLGWVIFQFNALSSLLPVIGIVMTAVGGCGTAAAHQNAKGLVGSQSRVMFVYIYGVILLIPIILLVVVGCFSFNSTLTSFVRHSWDASSADQLRQQFCASGSADHQCRAPVMGGRDFNSTDDWCAAACPSQGLAQGALLCEHNTTGCEGLVDSAQDDAREWLADMSAVTGALCLLNVLLLAVGACFAIRLLTLQVFMKKMLTAINAEALPSCVLCLLCGVYALHRQYFVGGLVWVAWMFIAVGIACAVLAGTGLVADHFKRRSLLGLYTLCAVLVMVLSSALALTCWVLAGRLSQQFQGMSPGEVQDIPCRASFEGCCCCGEDEVTEEVCPEWSSSEVEAFVRLILQLLGLASCFVMFFMGCGFGGAVAWYRSLELYQCEAV